MTLQKVVTVGISKGGAKTHLPSPMGSAGRVSALLFLLVAGAVANDQIFTTSGVTFGRSSREPRYHVEFHPVDSPFHRENGQESVPMTNHEGKRYKCFLPVEETKTMKSMLPQNATNVIIESDRRIKPKEPDELLEVLKDQCFYRHEGWWSYEFCYHGKIRQVHVDDDKVIQEFVLGEFDDDATAAYHENSTSELADDGHQVKDISKRYHVHLYKNGTVCDLTDIPRETEVRFVCSEPTVLISSIKEISSCKYVLTIQSPMLCKNPKTNEPSPSTAMNCLLKQNPLRRRMTRFQKKRRFPSSQIRTIFQLMLLDMPPIIKSDVEMAQFWRHSGN